MSWPQDGSGGRAGPRAPVSCRVCTRLLPREAFELRGQKLVDAECKECEAFALARKRPQQAELDLPREEPPPPKVKAPPKLPTFTRPSRGDGVFTRVECSRCHIWIVAATGFNRDGDGIRSECKQCEASARKTRATEASKALCAARNRRYRNELRSLIAQARRARGKKS